jgi:hypothetical protein
MVLFFLFSNRYEYHLECQLSDLGGGKTSRPSVFFDVMNSFTYVFIQFLRLYDMLCGAIQRRLEHFRYILSQHVQYGSILG